MNESMIYDREKKQWYQLTRNIFGTLKLKKINYASVIKAVTPNDFVVEANTLKKPFFSRLPTPT